MRVLLLKMGDGGPTVLDPAQLTIAELQHVRPSQMLCHPDSLFGDTWLAMSLLLV